MKTPNPPKVGSAWVRKDFGEPESGIIRQVEKCGRGWAVRMDYGTGEIDWVWMAASLLRKNYLPKTRK
jgi:hypothetical protein